MKIEIKTKIIFVLVTILFLSPVISKSQTNNQRLFDTIPFMSPEDYSKKIATFNDEPVKTGGILFLGNSITAGGKWVELLDDSNVVNRGIGGDITFGVLKRLDEISRIKPAKLFMLIGINDIGKDIPDAVIAENCGEIIRKIKEGSPGTSVYLQSIMPVNPTIKNFPQHYDKQDHIIATNKLLKQTAKEEGITYINLYPVFLNKKKLMDEKYTLEGLHLNAEGYKVWVKYLKEKNYL